MDFGPGLVEKSKKPSIRRKYKRSVRALMLRKKTQAKIIFKAEDLSLPEQRLGGYAITDDASLDVAELLTATEE